MVNPIETTVEVQGQIRPGPSIRLILFQYSNSLMVIIAKPSIALNFGISAGNSYIRTSGVTWHWAKAINVQSKENLKMQHPFIAR